MNTIVQSSATIYIEAADIPVGSYFTGSVNTRQGLYYRALDHIVFLGIDISSAGKVYKTYSSGYSNVKIIVDNYQPVEVEIKVTNV